MIQPVNPPAHFQILACCSETQRSSLLRPPRLIRQHFPRNLVLSINVPPCSTSMVANRQASTEFLTTSLVALLQSIRFNVCYTIRLPPVNLPRHSFRPSYRSSRHSFNDLGFLDNIAKRVSVPDPSRLRRFALQRLYSYSLISAWRLYVTRFKLTAVYGNRPLAYARLEGSQYHLRMHSSEAGD